MNAINEKYIRGHFKTDKLGGYVFGIAPDGQKFMFAQVRGWGQLQKLPNGGEIQDANLEHMVRALNAHFLLLEALKGLVEAADQDWPHAPKCDPAESPCCCEVIEIGQATQKARAAIAKAEGENELREM